MYRIKKFKIQNPIIILFFFLYLINSCNKQTNELIGSYQSISESEWNLTLILSPNSDAEIIVENWIAGEYNKRNIDKTKCKWSSKNNMVFIYYENIIDTLIYDSNLSLEVIGEENGAPGLLQSKSNYDGILNNVFLWKLPHNF